MAEPAALLHAEIEKYERKHVEQPDGRFFLPLANAYREAGDLERAERLLRDGLQRHPDYLSARVVLGQVLVAAGASESAASEFRRVLTVDPQNVLALRGLAELKEGEGRLEEAGHWYSELLAADPQNEDALGGLARIEEQADRDVIRIEPEPGPLPEPEALTTKEPEPITTSEPAEVTTVQPADAPLAASDELVSETLAELYARQGHTERAAGMYRELIRQRGAEPLLVRRLAELEAGENSATDPELEPIAAERIEPGHVAAEPVEAEPVEANLLDHAPREAAADPGSSTVAGYFAALLVRPHAADPEDAAAPADRKDREDEYMESVQKWLRSQ